MDVEIRDRHGILEVDAADAVDAVFSQTRSALFRIQKTQAKVAES